MKEPCISIDFVISDGKDGLKKLTLDADALRKIMEQNVKVAQSFEKKLFFMCFVINNKPSVIQLITEGYMCPERDSNPHSRKGQGILSPSCLPFHHPGKCGAKLQIFF